jgi:predicted dehydrogenase
MFAEVEAIIIASPTETHYKITADSLNAGKPTLVEKPLAKTSAEAQELLALARAKNLTLAVGFIERFNPAFQALCKLVKKEKILGVDIKRLSPFPERITDANVIQDMMIHDLDLLLNLLPRDEIESLKAEGKKIKTKQLDQAVATVYFRSGTIAKVEANRAFDSKVRTITVSTEGGIIEANLLEKKIYVRDFQHHLPSVHFTQSYDQLTAELKDFIGAIKNGVRPTVDGEDGLLAIKLAEEVEKACS